MTEQLQEAFESLKNRFKNSFIITFIIVWCIQHWKLIYSIWNFDKDENRVSKVAFIKTYISDNNMFWGPLLVSILSLIGIYLIFIVSDVINDGYNLIRNEVLNKIKSKKVVRIEDYTRAVKELDKMRSRVGAFQLKENDYIVSKQGLEETVLKQSSELEELKNQNGIYKINLESQEGLKTSYENKTHELLEKDKDLLELSLNLHKEKEKYNTQLLKINKLETNILRLVTLSNSLEAYKLWTKQTDLYSEWAKLSDKVKNEYIQKYISINEFQALFGNMKWIRSNLVEGKSPVRENVTLIDDRKLAFKSDYGNVYEVTNIKFSSEDYVEYDLFDIKASKILKSELTVDDIDTFHATEGGNDVIYSRIKNSV